MNIHEYQAKEIFRTFNLPVPEGGVAKTPAQAEAIAKKLNSKIFVVKSQIHAGGRGKGTVYSESGGKRTKVLQGGVQISKSVKEVRDFSEKILGNILVTHQSGEEGKKVNNLLIEQGLDIARELYLGAVLDREKSQWVIMLSTEGGMDIEEVAAKRPEKIHKIHIDRGMGLMTYQVKCLISRLGLNNPEAEKNLALLLPKFFKCFIDTDCSLCEINPLVILKNNQVVALDGKMNFDDNALYRQPKIAEYRDLAEESPLEIEASKFRLNYIKLDGNIGCMVNGAGLAMATMDIIKYAGGEPANFLDVGGGVTKEGVVNAFKIILSDKAVQGIFVNIFGGIAKCDLIAQGIVDAAKEVKLNLPCVIRLDGTNVERGRKIIAESKLGFLMAQTMHEGAQKIVAAVQKAGTKSESVGKTSTKQNLTATKPAGKKGKK